MLVIKQYWMSKGKWGFIKEIPVKIIKILNSMNITTLKPYFINVKGKNNVKLIKKKLYITTIRYTNKAKIIKRRIKLILKKVIKSLRV